MEDASENRVVIAAAGSGKTSRLVDEALARPSSRILITTFTEANEVEIRRKFFEKAGSVPPNVTMQTWFSFLLEHGARPYQGQFVERRIQGVQLVNGTSAFKVNEAEITHYLNSGFQLYSDKMSKFVVKCNDGSQGRVITRLCAIFDEIFVDEVQDLAGYDLEIVELLFDSPMNTLLVGDPRQATYSTNNSPKYKKFRKAGIFGFFEEMEKQRTDINIDATSLNTNHRCGEVICALSNELYPGHEPAKPGQDYEGDHCGVFTVERSNISAYLASHDAVQLRNDKRMVVEEMGRVFTFGDSKGLSFDRVLIYPTKPYLQWLGDHSKELKETSRSKLYVALTRARFSVGIVVDNGKTVAGFPVWSPKEP